MNASDLALITAPGALLSRFSEGHRAEILAGSQVKPYAPGECILRRGDEVHFLGLVLEGTIEGSVTHNAERHALGELGAGETFGDFALMSGETFAADLVARTVCRVLQIPLTLFRSHILAEPRAVQHVAQIIGHRFQQLMGDPARAGALQQKSEDFGGLELKGERPETILVLNCGSSSIKYSLFETERPESTVHGQIERIGTEQTHLVQRGSRGELSRELPRGGYAEAFGAMMAALTDPEAEALDHAGAITAVGHRVVHGGEQFTSPTMVDDTTLAAIESLSPLAPLHNPVNVAGIRAAQAAFPGVPHVAVFDTAFHATLPSQAYLYGLPREFYEKRGVRRYGFHGLSHGYVALAAARWLERPARQLRTISCHLGNGASLCAIDHGRSVDTTMGLTPGEGLLMGTRCGDVDAGVLAYLEREHGYTSAQLDELLNKRSGLLGLSGVSSDMREIERAADAGHAHAIEALKAFCYRIRKYIGSYVAAMGGIDVLIFTAGIGQGSAGVRATALQGLECMGIQLDQDRNLAAGGSQEIARISTDDSPVAVLVVPTDEERMIARETLRALSRDYLVRTSEACRTVAIPIEVSAHHIHLSQEDVETLFGAGHQLTKRSDLSQPGQYACEEQLTIVGPKGRIERVRVLGPTRKATQVEIAMTEQFKLGIFPPIRESGDLDGSPGCALEGPAGRVELGRGVICALRHIHMTPADALRYGLRDKATVRVRVGGDRELGFGDVRIRVDQNFALAMHIDTDEANAAHLANGAQGFIERIQAEE